MKITELKKLKPGTPILGLEDFSELDTLSREVTLSLTCWNMRKDMHTVKVDFLKNENIKSLSSGEVKNIYLDLDEGEIELISLSVGKPVGIYLGFFEMPKSGYCGENRIFIKMLINKMVGWFSCISLEEKVYIY